MHQWRMNNNTEFCHSPPRSQHKWICQYMNKVFWYRNLNNDYYFLLNLGWFLNVSNIINPIIGTWVPPQLFLQKGHFPLVAMTMGRVFSFFLLSSQFAEKIDQVTGKKHYQVPNGMDVSRKHLESRHKEISLLCSVLMVIMHQVPVSFQIGWTNPKPILWSILSKGKHKKPLGFYNPLILKQIIIIIIIVTIIIIIIIIIIFTIIHH